MGSVVFHCKSCSIYSRVPMSGGEGATHLHDEPGAAAGEEAAGREPLAAAAVADVDGRHDAGGLPGI